MYTYMEKSSMKTRIIAAAVVLLLLASCFVPFSSARADVAKIDTEQTGTVTGECTITMPEGLSEKEYRITDNLVETYQTFEQGQTLKVDLPDGAQGLYLEWYNATTSYQVVQQDASGATLSEDVTQPFMNAYYPLADGVKSVSITMSGEASLSTLAVYGAGELPSSVQRWTTPGKADLLVVASTPNTALDQFFGVIATYAGNHDIPTALVVMSRYSRSAQEELLSGLWLAGYDTYPVFGDFFCENNGLYKMVRNMWGRKTALTYLQDQIAAFSPKVIVTHAGDETAPDGAAQFTGEFAERAADGLGVQKIYFASDSGQTKLDYTQPLNGVGGKTVEALAADAFLLCKTRHIYETQLSLASGFLLQDSEVGDDATGNDLFENIDQSSLGAYVDPTPAPSATPEPTATPEPAAEPTTQPEQTQPEAQAQQSADVASFVKGNLLFVAIPAGGLVLSLILLFAFGLKRRHGKRNPGAVMLSLLPLLLSLLASGALYYFGRKITPPAAIEATPTPAAEAAATPEATEAPEATATPEAEEVAPSASDEYYRSASDPAEVIVVDKDKGHWEYKTDELSILIDRIQTTYTNYGGNDYPLVYFVAHIRMRDVNNFRTVQSAANRNGAGALKPWLIARRNKAVLMITGDNLTESDTEYKSILIRDGKVFLDSEKCDVLAMYPDMTLKIYSPKETSASELLMDGVRDAFSFGPTLMRDGKLTTEDIDHAPRIGNETNPRTGLGMVEPGHFVAIIVDGRQKEYSFGMRLTAFADLFVKEGCVEAYNLDGGVSACMLFMGEQLNRHGNKHVGTIEDSYQRRIPDGLVWGYSDSVPSEDDPIYNTGEGG